MSVIDNYRDLSRLLLRDRPRTKSPTTWRRFALPSPDERGEVISRHRRAEASPPCHDRSTMDDDVELISRRRVFDDFLKVDEAMVRAGGEVQRRMSLERGDSRRSSSGEDGAILLTRQFRYPTLEHGPGYLLELPAGA